MYLFFLVLVGLPYLVVTNAFLIHYLIKRNRISGISCLVLFLLPLALFAVNWLSSPVKPDKADIIGHYVIDRSRWPGHNTDWQHKTYTLEITEAHAILRDTRTKTIWKYRIEWSEVYGHFWTFADSSKRHHMVDNGPILFREPFGHYYVFQSPLYENVFFKKN